MVTRWNISSAATPHAAPYQTQIDNELRAIIEHDEGMPFHL
jgi:hypothetical protein